MNLNQFFTALVILLALSCDEKKTGELDGGTEVKRISDSGGMDVKLTSEADKGGDKDADAHTHRDSASRSDARVNAGTDAGERCEEGFEGDRCSTSLECFCESRPSVCNDTVDKARMRAEVDEEQDGGSDYCSLCFSLCTNGEAFFSDTDIEHGETRYFSSNGELIGIYVFTDVPTYCDSRSDGDWEKQFELYAGTTEKCEVACQVGVDCDRNYPRCD